MGSGTHRHGSSRREPLNGTLQLQNVSFNDAHLPSGISKANGTIELSGNGASLRNLTAESGGGKLSLTGFALMMDTPRFGLRVNASGVRLTVQQLTVQQGISVAWHALNTRPARL